MQNTVFIFLGCALDTGVRQYYNCCFSPVPQIKEFCTERWIMILSPANTLWILWNCHWELDQLSQSADTFVHLFVCLTCTPHAIHKPWSKDASYLSHRGLLDFLLFSLPWSSVGSGLKCDVEELGLACHCSVVWSYGKDFSLCPCISSSIAQRFLLAFSSTCAL